MTTVTAASRRSGIGRFPGCPTRRRLLRDAEIIRRCKEIPPGFVRTYGDISPGAPRYGGAVLRHTDRDVPWHRVVRADGSLTQGDRQRALLEDEGVPFSGSRVHMRAARMPR